MLKKAQVIMLPHNDNNTKITLYKTASGKPLNLSTNTDILANAKAIENTLNVFFKN